MERIGIMTVDQDTGFRTYTVSPGQVAGERFIEFRNEAASKKMTAAQIYARIDAIPKKKGYSVREGKRRRGGERAVSADTVIPVRMTRHAFLSSAVLALVFSLILGGIVYSSVQVSDQKRLQSEMRESISESESEIRTLRRNIDALISRDEIKQIAIEQYGMIESKDAQSYYMMLDSSTETGAEKETSESYASTSLLSAFASRVRSIFGNR